MRTKKIKKETVENISDIKPEIEKPELNPLAQIFLGAGKVSYKAQTEAEYRAQLNKMIKMDIQTECVRVGAFKPLDDRNKMIEKLVKEFNKNHNMQFSKLENKTPRLSDQMQNIIARIF